MKNIEIIKQLIIDNQQEYMDWTIKVVQDKLIDRGIYITNFELLSIINEVNTVEETPITNFELLSIINEVNTVEETPITEEV